MILAQEPDFRLGQVRVSPSRGVLWDGASEHRVTPQMMRALLTLLRAERRTISRDEFVEACWDRRIVSDNAISRVIADLRGLARQFNPEPFQLKTIPKIGFRLDAPAPEDAAEATPDARPAGAAPSRRFALAGAAGAAVVAGVGGGAWWTATRRLPPPARAAIASGVAAFRQMTPDQMTQAIAAFQRATVLAPRRAEGWAWLALAYQFQSRSGAPPDKARVLIQRAREAATLALKLEPGNAEAEAALAALRPPADRVAEGAALSTLVPRHPRNFSVNCVAADFYTSTGQLDLAGRCAQAALAADAGWPRLYVTMVLNAWSMGRLNEADDWMARGLSQWPRHSSLWFTRQRLLTYTGRAAEALAMIDDVGARPVGIPEWNFDQCRQESRALLTRAPEDIAEAVRGYRAIVSRGVGFAQNNMQFLSAMGHVDEAFALLETLFFGGDRRLGPWLYSQEQGQYAARARRDTWLLWLPPVAAMRADPRMLPILKSIGLTDYWRIANARPATPVAGF